MQLELLLGVAIVHIIGLAAPGPDIFLIMRVSLLYSKRQAIFAAFGITLGIIAWSLLTILGLNVFLKVYPQFDIALHLFGIGYLSYLVYNMVKDAIFAKLQKDINFDKSLNSKNMFWTGLLTNLSNPKVVMYFTLVLGSMLPTGNIQMQVLALILITLESFAWFSFVAYVFSIKSMRRMYFAKQKIIDIISALIFSVFIILLFIDLLSLF